MIRFLITTYNRQASCQRLVDSLQGLGDILVLNDGCNYKITGCSQRFGQRHNGRIGYWQLVSSLFLQAGNYDYYIMLPDDFLMCDLQDNVALELLKSIEDPKKICLNLFADRIGIACWTPIMPVDMGPYYKTGWVDMCFICEKSFFEAVRSIKAPFFAPSSRTRRGSGVGSHISKELVKKGYNFYQVKESLVDIQPEHCESKMLPRWNESRVSLRSRKGKRLFKL